MKKGVILLVLFILIINLSYAIDITSCQVIASAGVYNLNQSLVSTNGTSCISIASNDVLLNLNGFSISNSTNTNHAALNLSSIASNVTVTNGTLNNSYYGLVLKTVNNSQINNLLITSNSHTGIVTFTSSGFYNNISFNNITNNINWGIFLSTMSNNTLDHNIISFNGSSEGMRFTTSSFNNITNNIIGNVSTGISIFTLAADNFLNNNLIINTSSTGISILSARNNITNNIINNSGQFGINFASGGQNSTLINNSINNNIAGGIRIGGSKFINLENNTLKNNTYGITVAINSDSNNITGNIIESSGQAGIIIQDTAKNSLISLNTISGDTTGLASGIYLTTLNNPNKVLNNTIENNTYGIYVNYSNSSNITNNNINNNNYGVYTFVSSNNTLYFNNINNNNISGIFINNSNNNTIYSNKLNSNFQGINLISSLNNTLNSNEISDSYDFGLYLINTCTNFLSDFNFSNNSNAQIYLLNSTLNISGNINISNTLDTDLDFNISEGSYIYDSGLIKIITTYGNYTIDNASNVSIKSLNSTSSETSASGCGSSNFNTCNLITSNSQVINITNTSQTSSIILSMFYDINAANNLNGDTNSIDISSYSSGWSSLGKVSIDQTTGKITFSSSGISLFGVFGVVNFKNIIEEKPIATTVISGGGSSNNTIRFERTTIFYTSSILEVPDTLPHIANKFLFNFTCMSPYCSVTSREISKENLDNYIKDKTYKDNIFLGAVQFSCTGQVYGEVKFNINSNNINCDEVKISIIDDNIEFPKLSCFKELNTLNIKSIINKCSYIVVWQENQSIEYIKDETQVPPVEEKEINKKIVGLNYYLLILIFILLFILFLFKIKRLKRKYFSKFI